jgi:hypothetical protein
VPPTEQALHPDSPTMAVADKPSYWHQVLKRKAPGYPGTRGKMRGIFRITSTASFIQVCGLSGPIAIWWCVQGSFPRRRVPPV